MPSLRIMDPGLSTTLQDLGRRGYQRFGIPASGALDTDSLRIANHLVGNVEGTACLEFMYLGPSFKIDADSVRIAFCGGSAKIRVYDTPEDATGRSIPVDQSVTLHRGASVCVGSIRDSSSLYMAVEGGFDIAPTLGSLSTFLRGQIGGFEGRRLIAGDILPLVKASARLDNEKFAPPRVASTPTLRILPGPQVAYFGSEAVSLIVSSRFVVGSGSDRTGMRLDGSPVPHRRDFNIVSDPVVHGSIQIPGDGKPILLLADRQTTGGYPKIATVISADLPVAGRLPVGSAIAFQWVTPREADMARRAHVAFLDEIIRSIKPVEAMLPLEARLMSGNLVSGVVNANV